MGENDKENIEPLKERNQEKEEKAENEENEVDPEQDEEDKNDQKKEKNKKKKSKKRKQENEENEDEDEVESELAEFTEQRLFDDMYEFIKNKVLGRDNTKKEFRSKLEKDYNLEKKALKKHEPFKTAMERITLVLIAENEEKIIKKRRIEKEKARK